MITRVRIVNFQSLVDVDVTLGKLTVLSGPSNSGKSAFVRAVRVLLSNPRGSWYMREGADASTRAGLAISDPGVEFHVNIWRAKQVSYSIERPSDKLEYTAVGTSVPEPVLEVLRMDPVLQVPDQFDRPYLLFDTPSVVAKSFGAITESDRLMKAVSHANTTARDHKNIAAVTADIIVRDRELLEEKYAWYTPAAADMFSLAEIRDDIKALRERLRGLTFARDAVSLLSATASWQTPAEAPSLGPQVDELDRAVLRIDLLRRIRDSVLGLQNDIGLDESQLTSYQAILEEHYHDLSTIRGLMAECPTCGQVLADDEVREHVISHT